MPLDPRSILKTYFETGDIPTESQFQNLIDSMLTLELIPGPSIDQHSLSLDAATGGFLQDALGQSVLLGEGARVDGNLAPGESYASPLSVGAGSGLPGESGYLALSFDLPDGGGGTTTHYGFLEIAVEDAASSDPYAIELVGFAYETTPHTPVTTFALPEPGTGLLLALGLVVSALFRRRGPRADG